MAFTVFWEAETLCIFRGASLKILNVFLKLKWYFKGKIMNSSNIHYQDVQQASSLCKLLGPATQWAMGTDPVLKGTIAQKEIQVLNLNVMQHLLETDEWCKINKDEMF